MMKKCCHNCYRFYFCSIARKSFIEKKDTLIQINITKYKCSLYLNYEKNKKGVVVK